MISDQLHDESTSGGEDDVDLSEDDEEREDKMATIGLSKVFILDKYFTELQKFWETERKVQGILNRILFTRRNRFPWGQRHLTRTTER